MTRAKLPWAKQSAFQAKEDLSICTLSSLNWLSSIFLSDDVAESAELVIWQVIVHRSCSRRAVGEKCFFQLEHSVESTALIIVAYGINPDIGLEVSSSKFGCSMIPSWQAVTSRACRSLLRWCMVWGMWFSMPRVIFGILVESLLIYICYKETAGYLGVYHALHQRQPTQNEAFEGRVFFRIALDKVPTGKISWGASLARVREAIKHQAI